MELPWQSRYVPHHAIDYVVPMKRRPNGSRYLADIKPVLPRRVRQPECALANSEREANIKEYMPSTRSERAGCVGYEWQ
jgi:hypothetical protein